MEDAFMVSLFFVWYWQLYGIRYMQEVKKTRELGKEKGMGHRWK